MPQPTDRTLSAAQDQEPTNEDPWTGEPDPNEDAVRFALDRSAAQGHLSSSSGAGSVGRSGDTDGLLPEGLVSPPASDSPAATRCDTKGCPSAPTEKVPDVKLPHVVYDLCASCATGMRALQALPEGSLIDARNFPPLTFKPLAEHPAARTLVRPLRGALVLELGIERHRQDEKWGGIPGIDRRDDHTYAAVLGEEFGEVCQAWLERDTAALRVELIQTATVALAWIEELDNGGSVPRA